MENSTPLPEEIIANPSFTLLRVLTKNSVIARYNIIIITFIWNNLGKLLRSVWTLLIQFIIPMNYNIQKTAIFVLTTVITSHPTKISILFNVMVFFWLFYSELIMIIQIVSQRKDKSPWMWKHPVTNMLSFCFKEIVFNLFCIVNMLYQRHQFK